MTRVGRTIYMHAPYMTAYLMKSLRVILNMYCIHMVLADLTHGPIENGGSG